jgi:L-rhamnose isomerase
MCITHTAAWIEWARSHDIGLDFNTTFFAHPRADSGATLSHADEEIRAFWIEHARRCRVIAAAMGAELGTPCAWVGMHR